MILVKFLITLAIGASVAVALGLLWNSLSTWPNWASKLLVGVLIFLILWGIVGNIHVPAN